MIDSIYCTITIIPACRLATKNSQLDLTLDLFLGEIPAPEKNKIGYTFGKHTRTVVLISYFDGMVSGYHKNVEEIKKLPSVQMVKIDVQVGEPLRKTIDLITAPGLIVLSNDSQEQLEKDYLKIREYEKEGLFKLKEDVKV